MKYILYDRKNTEEDDRPVLSIEVQLAEPHAYAAKEKLEICRLILRSENRKRIRRKTLARAIF